MEPRPDRRAEAAAQAQAHLGHRTRLAYDGNVRDLAVFNVAIDSRLRGCDLVKLRVADVDQHGVRPTIGSEVEPWQAALKAFAVGHVAITK